MAMTMAMAVAVGMQSMRPAAEAAICRAAILGEPPVGAARRYRDASGPAVASAHKAHRHRTNGRGTHHGKDDTA
jgi:hypothetical protein